MNCSRPIHYSTATGKVSRHSDIAPLKSRYLAEQTTLLLVFQSAFLSLQSSIRYKLQRGIHRTLNRARVSLLSASKLRDQYLLSPHHNLGSEPERWEQMIQRSRVRMLEFMPDGVVSTTLGTAEDLAKYLQRARSNGCKHHLYLVEDFDQDVINVLRSHFPIEPYLVDAQSSKTFQQSGLPRKLVSMQSPTEQYTLTYLEVNRLEDPKQHYNIFYEYTEANTKRQIFFDKIYRDDVFYIQRNASFWGAPMQGGGWNAIILLEPEAKFTNPVYNSHRPYTPDYNLYTGLVQANHLPMRSMLDNIEYYWTQMATKSDITNAFSSPDRCAIYLKRIVAAHWNVALDYLGKRLYDIQTNMWEYEEGRGQQELVNQLKRTIQLATEWRRKVSWFIEGVQWSLETLGVDRSQSEASTDRDYALVLHWLQDLKTELDSIATAVIGVQGTIQGQVSLDVAERSRKEAELSRQLSFIALIFVPLAYSASLLSMGGDFLPGSRLFGVYFAVAILITLLTLLVFRLLASRAAANFLSILLGRRE
ncbi:hypothetical protein F5Y08DRAFT_297214 [Xylaria arbuscula]|nr:hypothetical protein F5Y08DRAFT_297214 [Xylaria arbuscula]